MNLFLFFGLHGVFSFVHIWWILFNDHCKLRVCLDWSLLIIFIDIIHHIGLVLAAIIIIYSNSLFIEIMFLSLISHQVFLLLAIVVCAINLLHLFNYLLVVSKYLYVAMLSQLLSVTYMHIIRDPHVFDLVVEVSLSIVLFQWDLLVVGMNWGLWLIIDWVSLVVYLELLILLFANNVIEYTVRDTSFVRYTCMGVLWSLFLSQLIEFSFIIGEVFSNTNRSMSFCPWLIVNTLLDFHLILVKIII